VLGILGSATPVSMIPAALADQPPTQPATQPTTRPTTQPANPEAHRRAMQIIEEALAKYRAAKTYQDKVAGHFELVAADKDGQDVGQVTDSSASALSARPNRAALIGDTFSIHSNGERLWLYSVALDEYTESAAPEQLDYTMLMEELMVDDPPHPVLYVLSHPDKSFAELFPAVREFTAVVPEKRDDRPGLRVSGIFDATDTPFGFGPELVPFSLWFDEKTGLLGELRLELADLFRKMMGLTEQDREPGEPPPELPGMPKRIDRAQATATFSDVKIDTDIPADQFVFKPPKEARKVDEFSFASLMEMPDPQKLIGKPAADFSGNGLDEKPLSLEGLRGRVVVLDFWATWCVPCVQATPLVQKLHEKFADQPVTVVGVNQDARGMEKKVKKFLEDKKVTFRQFLDPYGKLGRRYNVGGIPCTFLIDKKGTIQAVHTGFTPNLQEELGPKIEKLLKGENLFDPEKLGEQAEEAEPPAKPKTP
jgi:thiol-disulfide isomerase/thioredoxin